MPANILFPHESLGELPANILFPYESSGELPANILFSHELSGELPVNILLSSYEGLLSVARSTRSKRYFCVTAGYLTWSTSLMNISRGLI